MTPVTFPVFIFGSLIAGFIGSIIHLILGGKPFRLLLSIISSWIGFWLGNNLGSRYSLNLFNYGQINLGFAILLSVLLGLAGYWISGENQKPSN